MQNPKATIIVDSTTHMYKWNDGCCSSRVHFKTFKGALKAAIRNGYDVAPQADPMVEFVSNQKRTKIVTNMISGKLVRIPYNTPNYCDPSSEAYWSM